MDNLFINSAYLGPDFQKHIALMGVVETSEVGLKVQTLERRMEVEEVIKEFKPLPITLGKMISAIKNNSEVLKNGLENIFFINDKDGILRSVVAYYYEDGWHFGANLPYNTLPCQCRFRWSAGCKVFST